jgi:hypothetical protein
MRDSITYNLKYFIMKMSGTKPMKNTMRKQSPLKFAVVTATAKGTTKPVEGKPSSKPAAPRGPLARAKAKAAVSSRTTKQSPLKFFQGIGLVKDSEGRLQDAVDAMKNSQRSGGDNAAAKKAAYLKGKKSATTETASEAKARQEKVKAARAMSKTDRATAAKAKMDKYKSGSKSTNSTETSTKPVPPKPTPTTETPTKPAAVTGTPTTTPAMQLKKFGMKKTGMKKKC